MTKIQEKYMDPETLRLTQFQKRVLRILNDNENPKIAFEELSRGDDQENLKAAADLLQQYGFIDQTDSEASLTDIGQKAIDDYNIADDPTLAPTDQPPTTGGTPISNIDGFTESFQLLKSINEEIILNKMKNK